MHTPAERLPLIESLRRLPEQLAASVTGWADAQLDTRPAPAEWCARQIVHHVADSHMNGFTRVKVALTEDKPTIKPYDQVGLAELPDSTQLPLEVSLMILRGIHARWVYLLEHLTEAQFQRSFYHPGSQEWMTIDEHLALYSRHGQEHLEQIARIPQQVSW
jgi:hypothetical protein